MNPSEERINFFLEDTVLYSAVKDVLEAQFDLNKLTYSEDKGNVQIFEELRGYIVGKKLLEKGFNELEKFRKSSHPLKDLTNPAV